MKLVCIWEVLVKDGGAIDLNVCLLLPSSSSDCGNAIGNCPNTPSCMRLYIYVWEVVLALIFLRKGPERNFLTHRELIRQVKEKRVVSKVRRLEFDTKLSFMILDVGTGVAFSTHSGSDPRRNLFAQTFNSMRELGNSSFYEPKIELSSEHKQA